MRDLLLAGFLAAVSLAGCAQRAELVPATEVSAAKYDGWSCAELAREKAAVDQALARASATQNQAADTDALSVFLLGLPISGGGVEAEIARLRGEQEALRLSMESRGCG